ncbi:MAG: cytochrome c oxidase assembly protein [Mycobacteriales bacterium]
MTGPAPLTSTTWLTTWSVDLPVVVTALLLTAAYLILASRQHEWPAARTGSFLLSMLVITLATCSFLGAYAHTLLWTLAAQDVLLAALAPVPLVLSRPLLLLGRAARSRPSGAPAFLGSLVVVGLLVAIYATGLDEARLRHPWLFTTVQLGLVLAGCGFAGPLFAERGSAHGLRALAAFLDGLLDAIPGLVVLAGHGRIAASYYQGVPRSWGPSRALDQEIGGSVMLVLSEAVGLPAILLVLIRWARSDDEDAAARDHLVEGERDAPETDAGAALQRPWWETNPGPLAERLGRRDGSVDDRPPRG